MIKTDLKKQVKAFLQTLSDKSDKTYAKYEEGLYPVSLFFEQYYQDDNRTKRVSDIEPEDINHVLSYFIIRKFMEGTRFRLNVAKSVKAFFKYLANTGAYDKAKAKTIVDMASHYAKQYPRIDKLESAIWDETEGEVDKIMLLPKKQQEKEIKRLKESVKDTVMQDVGYVEINKIDGNMVYGSTMLDGEYVGPIKLGKNSIALVQLGDIVNMITLRQKKTESFWEIAEMGYVYPKSYTNNANTGA